MLVSFTFENFKSFADEATLSLVAHRTDKSLPGVPIVVDEERGVSLLPAVAIYGPNAAGKTNIIYALRYMRDAVTESQASWTPEGGTRITSHSLRALEDSSFETILIVDGVRYRYGFSGTSSAFTREWLYSYPHGKERRLFERTTNVGDDLLETYVRYGKAFSGSEREHESSRRRTRSNSLFLAAAAQDNQAECVAISQWFRMSLNIQSVDEPMESDDIRFTTRMCFTHPEFKENVMALLRSADANIVDLEIIQRDVDLKIPDGMSAETAEYLHLNAKYDIRFVMGCNEKRFTLPFSVQSRGVQKLYALASLIVFGHKFGEVTLIDEIETSLHPHVATLLLSMYQSKSINKGNAQLIFSTHDTRFLNPVYLRRDQVWLVERVQSESHLYPLTDFSPRKDENLERGYLRGRYGAIPTVGFDPESFDKGKDA